MEIMTASEITNLALSCLALYRKLTDYRVGLARAGGITRAEDKEIEDNQNKLFDLATELNAQAVAIQISDLANPVNRITNATSKISNALTGLEKVRKIIGAIGSLVSLVSNLLTAIKTGNAAQIAAAIGKINNNLGPISTPLRASKNRSIKLKAPAIFSADSRRAAAGNPRTLAVPLIPQQRHNWCWAACADMVAHFYGNPSLHQCHFVNKRENKSHCCDLKARDCDVPINSGGVGPNYFLFGINATIRQGQITAAELQSEINAGRPVQLMYLFRNAKGHVVMGHVVLVHGWAQGPSGPHFLVNDPGPVNRGTRRRVTYQGLQQLADPRLGNGAWEKTWTGIK